MPRFLATSALVLVSIAALAAEPLPPGAVVYVEYKDLASGAYHLMATLQEKRLRFRATIDDQRELFVIEVAPSSDGRVQVSVVGNISSPSERIPASLGKGEYLTFNYAFATERVGTVRIIYGRKSK